MVFSAKRSVCHKVKQKYKGKNEVKDEYTVSHNKQSVDCIKNVYRVPMACGHVYVRQTGRRHRHKNTDLLVARLFAERRQPPALSHLITGTQTGKWNVFSSKIKLVPKIKTRNLHSPKSSEKESNGCQAYKGTITLVEISKWFATGLNWKASGFYWFQFVSAGTSCLPSGASCSPTGTSCLSTGTNWSQQQTSCLQTGPT